MVLNKPPHGDAAPVNEVPDSEADKQKGRWPLWIHVSLAVGVLAIMIIAVIWVCVTAPPAKPYVPAVPPKDVPQKPKMYATVFGGTGRVGSELVRQLLQDGKRLRLVLRTPAKATTMFGANHHMHLTQGNYLEMTSSMIGQAIQGSDSVVICSAANPAASVDFIRATGAQCAAQNTRLVYLSSWGAGQPWNPISVMINLVASNAFKYHLEKERVLREIPGLDYTIVRPSNFQGDKKDAVNPAALVVSQGSNPSGHTISIHNVAYGIKTVLERKELSNTTFHMWDKKEPSEIKHGGWSTLKPDSKPLPPNRHTTAVATYGTMLVAGGLALVAGCCKFFCP